MKRKTKFNKGGWGKRLGQKTVERQKSEDAEAKVSSGEVQESKAASDWSNRKLPRENTGMKN